MFTCVGSRQREKAVQTTDACGYSFLITYVQYAVNDLWRYYAERVGGDAR